MCRKATQYLLICLHFVWNNFLWLVKIIKILKSKYSWKCLLIYSLPWWGDFFIKKYGFNKRTAEYSFFIFIVFSFKTKLITMESSWDSTTEKGESGSAWNQMYWELLRTSWQRNLTIEGKIIIFKTLTLSKIVFLAQVLLIPNEVTTTVLRKQR